MQVGSRSCVTGVHGCDAGCCRHTGVCLYLSGVDAGGVTLLRDRAGWKRLCTECAGPHSNPMPEEVAKKSMFRRHQPCPGAHIYFGELNLFYLTVCSKDRSKWLNQDIVHSTLAELWQEEATAWLVGDYLLMPDHVHLFCAPRDMDVGIDRWVDFWKSRCSRKLGESEWRFQRKSFHHRIRAHESYHNKWIYTQQNPVRAGLVESAELWPFRGRVHSIVGDMAG